VAGILRGEIYWAELDPVRGREQAGRRPVLVISHDVFNERSGTVIGMAITGQQQQVGMPLAVQIESVRLPKPSWVKTSQIRVLSTERLGKKVGRLSPEELEQAIEGLFEIVA
jgi:mRNA interferase MazF